MHAFAEKTPEELGQMSIEDLLKHHTAVHDDYVSKCRDYQERIHNIITAKEQARDAQKRGPRELSRTLDLGADVGAWLKNLPADTLGALRDFFKGEK